jgi:hypothetical protein
MACFSDRIPFFVAKSKIPLESYKDSIVEDFRENPVCSIAGAISRIKEVTTLINTAYITEETVMDFPVQLKEKYALKPVFSVLDNAGYQHCDAVRK